METVTFKGKEYPMFQTNGNAARFCMPFALEVCKGEGYDICCGKIEWSLPNSIPIDSALDNNSYEAMRLPDKQVDYIFCSHGLEHLVNWVGVLDYWGTRLKKGGVMFLYLPDYSQEYWRPWSNRKHVNILTPQYLKDYFEDAGYKVFVSGVDLYNSFTVIATK